MEHMTFEEIASMYLPSGKELVLSRIKDSDKYALSQRINVSGKDGEHKIYVKNSIHLDLDSMIKLSGVLFEEYEKTSLRSDNEDLDDDYDPDWD